MMKKEDIYDAITDIDGELIEEAAASKRARIAKKEGVYNAQDLFTKLWIFIHGIACMTITGDYDLDEDQTLNLLREASRKLGTD